MSDTPVTKLPDGSAFCTTTILSEAEAMALPVSQRPLNYRIPGDLYHATFDAVGAASMCWKPSPSFEVFDSEEASEVALKLCFKIAEALEKKDVEIARLADESNSLSDQITDLNMEIKALKGRLEDH